MTIGEIITEAQEELGEVPGTEPYGDPIPWLTHAARAMDEIARRTRCYYATFRTDVTAGKAQVVVGSCDDLGLFEIEEARLTLGDGTPATAATVANLILVTPDVFAAGFGAVGYPYGNPAWSALGWQTYDWRSDPPAARPVALVTAGANNLRLYPAPDYSLAQALALTGFATPVKPGATPGDPANGWAVGDECPLPARAHDLVKCGAVLRRCRQYPRLYADRLTLWQSQFQGDLALLTAESRGLTRAGRVIGAFV